MAESICLYFQVHQPFRLRRYTVFEIGKSLDYFDEQKNKEIMQRIAQNCYLPMNQMLLKHIISSQGKLKVTFSITGSALEQFKMYAPEVIESFKELAETNCVDFLAETYYHSLSALYSQDEFLEQVQLHNHAIKDLFGITPKVFRNTELIYTNTIARYAEIMGFKGILTEGASHILGERTPNDVYLAEGTRGMKLLLKNYELSDDIAFRFSDVSWHGWPLKPKAFVEKIKDQKGSIVNLFMDYETFGEHQTLDTGIHQFMESLLDELIGSVSLLTVSEAADLPKKHVQDSIVDVPFPISWADEARDLSAWLGNKMQNSAIRLLYGMEQNIKALSDENLLSLWRKMQSSDHFYYMCTKYFNDGDVHKYFNPYETPYEAYIAYMNIINDLQVRIQNKDGRDYVDVQPKDSQEQPGHALDKQSMMI